MPHPKSQYRNVYWHKPRRKWIAKMHCRNGARGDVTVNLGYYPDTPEGEADAAKASDVCRLYLFEMSRLNPLVDKTPTFDGNPPACTPRAQILAWMMSHGALSPAEVLKIATPHQ